MTAMIVSYPTAAATDWEAEVLAAEERACQAFLAADIATLDALWAPEFLVNSPLNRLHERGTVLQLLTAGRLRHSSMVSTIERMYRRGDVVVVMGHDTVTDPPEGRTTHRRFTNVWLRGPAGWQTIARHAQVVPPTAS